MSGATELLPDMYFMYIVLMCFLISSSCKYFVMQSAGFHTPAIL